MTLDSDIEDLIALYDEQYPAERIDDRGCPFIGFIGLSVPRFDAHFTPCVEIGWRLAAEHWGAGLATEGARAVLQHAFTALLLDEIVSFTVPDNLASRRVDGRYFGTRSSAFITAKGSRSSSRHGRMSSRSVRNDSTEDVA